MRVDRAVVSPTQEDTDVFPSVDVMSVQLGRRGAASSVVEHRRALPAVEVTRALAETPLLGTVATISPGGIAATIKLMFFAPAALGG